MLEVITAPILQNLSKVRHGFFTRLGGVSTGCYASLNCCEAGRDNPDNVRENRTRAMAHFKLPLEALVSVKNIHSNKVIVLEKLMCGSEKPQADGIVTRLHNVMLGSDSADCPIVLLADDTAGVIGLAHAGWRGAKLGIIEEIVKQMQTSGAKNTTITAVISPCIAQDSYEVDAKFYAAFISDDTNNQSYFTPAYRADHFLFDLRSFVTDRLTKLNLKAVTALPFDTYSDERFFSCRKAFHQHDPDFGGQLSCIGLT